MRNFLFIKTATDMVTLPTDSLSHTEYTSATTVTLYFSNSKDGKDATVSVVLTVTSGKASSVVEAMMQQVASGSSASLKYDAVNGTYFTPNVTGITSITTSLAGAGLAATATALATARAINGVNFDGTADITVTAAAGTLSGNTLKATVTASSLTSVGTLSALTMGGTVNMDGETLNVNGGEVTGAASTTSLEYKGSADLDLSIKSDGNMTFIIDNDSDETGQSFSFKNNATTEIANLDESGNLQLDGVLTAKTFETLTANFFDDLGTIKHYLPISTQSSSEQTSDGNTITDYLAPCNLKVNSVLIKLPYTTTGSGNVTVGVESSDIGGSPLTKSIIETEVVSSVAATNDNDVLYFSFDSAAITVGQNLSITIQSDGDLSGSQNWFATIILEMDWNTRYTGSSAIKTS
jgi:hypothetical protein